MLKVCQRPELIQQLNHGLTFASDAVVNEQLLIKYNLWEYLTPCDADNINILNSCINRWRDEANKLYETTRFSYDPLSNFQYHETGKDTRTPDLTDERTPDLTDETTLGTDTTRAEAGYDVPRTLFDAEKTTNSGTDTVTHTGTDTVTHTGTDTTDHNLDRTGRSNVASQDLIAKERAIILDCISWYVEKFKDCFTVSLEINDYCCDRDLEPIADFLPPECGHGSESLTGKLDVIDNEIGALQQQLTDCCSNMSTEIEDLKKSVADSKELLAIAISDKGVPTASDDSFATMAGNISAIPTGPDWTLVANWDFTQSLTDTISGLTCDLGSYTFQESTGIRFTQNTSSRCRIPYQNTNYPDANILPRSCMAIEFDVVTDETYSAYGRTTLMAFGNQGNCLMHYNVNAPAGVTRWVFRFDNQGVDNNVYDSSLSGKTVRIEMFGNNASNWLTYYFYIDGEFLTSVTSPYSYTPNSSWICLGVYSAGGSYRGMDGGIISGMRIYTIAHS